MINPKRFVWIIIILSPLFLFGCSFKKQSISSLPYVIYREDIKIAEIKLEIANTSEIRAKGLMYRETLNDGDGMLFEYIDCKIRSFWMKNTSIPLSIAFISQDQIIREIYDMQPFDETSVKSTILAMWALEVPQGWFERVGVQIGDKLAKQ